MNHSFFDFRVHFHSWFPFFPFSRGRRKHRPESVFFPFSEYHIKNQISIFVHIFAHFIKNVFHNASRILYNKEKLLFPYKKHLVEIVKNVNLISILYILVWMHLAEDWSLLQLIPKSIHAYGLNMLQIVDIGGCAFGLLWVWLTRSGRPFFLWTAFITYIFIWISRQESYNYLFFEGGYYERSQTSHLFRESSSGSQ